MKPTTVIAASPASATPPAAGSPAARGRFRYVSRWTGQIMIYLLLIAGSLLFLLPLFWMITTALKPLSEVYTFPPEFIPRTFLWQNFLTAWTAQNFDRYFLNTVFITVWVLVGVLGSSTLCAFGFARLRFVGRDVLFICVLATMMLPGAVTLIPTYILFKLLGWLDSFKPLIIPAWFGGGAFNIFLLRQFFLTLPVELEDAARIDGASTFGIFWQIFLPLSKPALAVVAVFTFQGVWNDFLGPLIYLNSPDKFTLALGIYAFIGQYNTQENLMMAVALIMVIPVIVIFFLSQRQLVEGVVMTGVKG